MRDVIAGFDTELRHEPLERRVRAKLGSHTAVDSTRVMLVWEPRRVVPTYAVPAVDIDAELTPAPVTTEPVAGVLHPGIPFSVHTTPGEPVSVGERIGAGFRFADPDLAGYVELDFDAFDEWHDEDERIYGHPRSPFHSIEIRRSMRPVRIELNGELIAETTGTRLLDETSLPLRFYIPLEDVRAELHPSEIETYCPHKGQASYWSLESAGRRHDGLGWTYREPLPGAAEIAGLVSFWNELLDVYVDGELRPRPKGPFADALRDEFGFAA